MGTKLLSFICSQIKGFKVILMNRGLRFRLGLFFTLVSLLPLMALGTFSYIKSSKTIQDITSRYSSGIISEININMLLRFKNIYDMGKVLLNNNIVKEILNMEDSGSGNSVNDNAKMRLLLETIINSNENIRSVYILPHKNRNIIAVGEITQDRGVVFLNDEYRKNYKMSMLYQDTIQTGNNYIWWPTQNVLGKNVFILSEKLHDEEKGVLGVLIVHIDAGIMDSVYNSMKTGENSKMYLLDGRGRILFHPDKTFIGKQIANKDILKMIQQDEKGSFVLRENEKSMFLVYSTFSRTNWKAIVITSYEELISEAQEIVDATILISMVCLILVIFFSMILTRSIVNPIHKLMELMKRGSTGDMKVSFNVKYNDEIGQLGDSFNKMISNIEKLIKMLEIESSKKMEAEIRALEAQINPHFFYNTLASIYWSAMAKGNTEIGKMASALSNFFRLGLNKGKEFTTVEKEVEHVKEFLLIQNMLYKNLFEYQVTADPDVFNYKTIKLILQPLAENSILHGIDKKSEKGFLKIEVFKRDRRIVFRVIDNGVGIPDINQERLHEIVDSGFGLKNIMARLMLYFNNDFTVDCSSIPDRETVFEITIPAINSEEVV